MAPSLNNTYYVLELIIYNGDIIFIVEDSYMCIVCVSILVAYFIHGANFHEVSLGLF